MRGWRVKFIFILIVYFAGFATAIYTLAPVPDKEQSAPGGLFARRSGHGARITSGQFVKSFNAGMHKCVDFGKDAAWRTAEFIKQEIDQKQAIVN